MFLVTWSVRDVPGSGQQAKHPPWGRPCFDVFVNLGCRAVFVGRSPLKANQQAFDPAQDLLACTFPDQLLRRNDAGKSKW